MACSSFEMIKQNEIDTRINKNLYVGMKRMDQFNLIRWGNLIRINLAMGSLVSNLTDPIILVFLSENPTANYLIRLWF